MSNVKIEVPPKLPICYSDDWKRACSCTCVYLISRNQTICVSDLQHNIHAPAQPQLPHADSQQSQSLYLLGLWPQVQTPQSLQGTVQYNYQYICTKCAVAKSVCMPDVIEYDK